jgi:hypothetical protein
VSLFRNPPRVVFVVSLFLALFVASFAVQCRAADFQFEGGSTVVRGHAPALAVVVTQPDVVAGRADIEYMINLIGSSTFRGEDQPNQIVAGVQLVNGYGPVDLGLGLVVMQNEDAYNSGDVNFSLSLRYTYRSFSVVLRHYSNAGSSFPNYGRDVLMASWRF